MHKLENSGHYTSYNNYTMSNYLGIFRALKNLFVFILSSYGNL